MSTELSLVFVGVLACASLVLLVGKKGKKLSNVERILDSWDRISDKLREEGYQVWPRLSRDKESVEFRGSLGVLLASVSVNGGEGYPLFATVVSPQPLSRAAQLPFEKELSALVAVKFEVEV